MTDPELITGILKRDRRSFDLFYDRYAQIIFNLCVRILKDEGEAQDVLQEIFLQIWRDAERFDPARASVKTWLFTIARSRSLDRYRSRKVAINRVEDQPDDQLQQIAAKEDFQAASVTQQYVLKALARLSNEQRLVLELSYYEGLTQEEIADRLQEPLGTIKSRMRASLMKLRQLFSGEESDAEA
jgi:RNA polymerase sigma-70 factor (ECF subfamily)